MSNVWTKYVKYKKYYDKTHQSKEKTQNTNMKLNTVQNNSLEKTVPSDIPL